MSRLIIVESVNDFVLLKSNIIEFTDVLVFSQSVMILLDKEDIKYNTIEDYYTNDAYFNDVNIFEKDVSVLFEKLDNICHNSTNFPFSFSGNSHCLLKWLTNTLYIEKLITSIRRKYKEVFFYSEYSPSYCLNYNLNFTELSSKQGKGDMFWISLPIENSEQRKLDLILRHVGAIYIKDVASISDRIPFKEKLKGVLYSLNRYIGSNFKKKPANCVDFKGESIYFLQDVFEAKLLKRYLTGFKYLSPIRDLKKDSRSRVAEDLSDISIEYALKIFTKKYFNFLESYVIAIFDSYKKEVVGRVRYFSQQFEHGLIKDNPRVVIFGVGIVDVFDSICCYVSERYHIPVILFQHGGHSLYGYDPYQKSLEYNPYTLKTLIVQSREEVKVVNNSATEVKCFGSIQQYEERSLDLLPSFEDKILLCLGPDSDLLFRHFLNDYNINKKHNQSIDILSVARGLSLSIDIKLHPDGQDNSYKCFSKIIKKDQLLNTNIIYGDFVELISRKYKLIIVDFFQSAIIKHVMCIDLPIIVYDYNFDNIRADSGQIDSLHKRCYIARNKIELLKYLERYKLKELPSKYDINFIDKYIYPIKDGSPGINIAKYIKDTF